MLDIEIVVASKSEEKASDAAAVIAVISARDIESFGAMSLVDVIDRVANMYVLSTPAYPSNMISIRGDNTDQYNNHVLIMIDGRPIRESMFLGENRAIYTMFPLSAIDRLEVLRGPGSVLYGTSAFTGVINIVTKVGAGQNVSAGVRYGGFERLQANVAGGTKVGELELSGSVNYVNDKGWNLSMKDERAYERSTRMSEAGIGAMATAKFQGLRLSMYYGQTEQGTIGNTPVWGPPEYPARRDIDYRSSSSRLFLDGGYKTQVTDNWNATLNVTYNRLDFRFYYPVAQDQSRRVSSNDILIEQTNFVEISQNLKVILGGLVSFSQGEGVEPSIQSGPDGLSRPFDIFASANPNPFVFVPPTNQTFFSVYGNIEYKPIEEVKLIAGGQLNKAPSLDVDFVPRVAAVVHITSTLTGKLLYGQAFRSASISEKYRKSTNAYGSEDVKPEKIGTFEAQLNYVNKENGFQVSATYFNSAITNLIERSRPADSLLIVNGVSVAKYINLGALYSQGIELEGIAVLSGNFSLQWGISYQTNRDNRGNTDYTGMPRFMGKVGASYTTPEGLTLTLFNSYYGTGGDIRAVNAYNPPADAFSFLTANAQIFLNRLLKFSSSPDIILEIYGTNLLNAKVYYPEYGRRIVNTIPGRAERAIYATLRISF